MLIVLGLEHILLYKVLVLTLEALPEKHEISICGIII